MPKYQYGEMFAKLGVPNMGHQGSGWCGLDPQGVLVLMSHQNSYKKRGDKWFYDQPGDQRLPAISPPAARSVRMLADYYRPDREVLLPVGVFEFDGEICPDGSHKQAQFSYATGTVYRALMREFDVSTCKILFEVVDRFDV